MTWGLFIIIIIWYFIINISLNIRYKTIVNNCIIFTLIYIVRFEILLFLMYDDQRQIALKYYVYNKNHIKRDSWKLHTSKMSHYIIIQFVTIKKTSKIIIKCLYFCRKNSLNNCYFLCDT